MSTTQVNKLGERLRKGPITEADLHLLDEYRRQFANASSEVERVLREEFRQQPASREAKSTSAICAKLQRERGSRLASMQDIAGCRIVVADRQAQRSLADALAMRFVEHRLIDRIAQPSHGYRALHLVVGVEGRRVEIQIRTELQHLWAQVCERIADKVGLEFKYGVGHPVLQQWLASLSTAVDQVERGFDGETMLAPLAAVRMMPPGPDMTPDRENLNELLQALVEFIPALGESR
ncbi:RelA/SpoT domain-containing protein [Roseateles sp. LYH14W]|uniref:RelA/SpoT domain-containing protein n=1 Tax=Pelomonas parva TaxID=3299032 RepID=A0ABW7F791_9BURK